MKILVTGSSSGIGLAITESLLNRGYKVLGLSRTHPNLLQSNSHYSHALIDFSDLSSLEKNLKPITKDPDIEAIICSAGYGHFAEVEQFSAEAVSKLMNVNFISQAILIKQLLPQLKKRKRGKIILVGSECALEGQKKGAFYSASKFALRGFSQSLRKECAGSSISVNLINPGMVDTPFFKTLRFKPKIGKDYSIDPFQIAQIVLMLIDTHDSFVFEEINVQPMKKGIEKLKDS